MDLNKLLRENLKSFTAYSSARDDYTGREGIFLDANENSLGSVAASGYNRYPDPYQTDLKKKIAQLKKVLPDQLFLGNGSDEAIDLLLRAFCEPRRDNVIIMPPSYGMYSVCARINDVKVVEVPLATDFHINYDKLKEAYLNAKIIFICSPNNPSANLMNSATVKRILSEFEGLVVIDEAYQDFSGQNSWLAHLDSYSNLVVLQTFSKAWGMAALRLGMAYAHPQIIAILNKIKYPYNINVLTQKTVLQALDNSAKKDAMIIEILEGRSYLQKALKSLQIVKNVFPSDANFLLVKFADPKAVYNKLKDKKVIVRDRSGLTHCQGCLRITVGTKEENEILINELSQFE